MPARNLVAVVLWMTGALLSFCAMAVSVRVLAGTLSVMEILALRAGLGLAVMASLAATRADLRATINSGHLPLHLFRNAVHVGSSYLWAMSLLLIPLAMTFALEFTTPAWTLLLAAPVLGERLTASRVGAVVFGLFGVLVILRPGLDGVSAGRVAGVDGGVRVCRHTGGYQEAHAHGQPVRHHLLDDADPVAARLDHLRSAVPDAGSTRHRSPPSSVSVCRAWHRITA